MCYFWKRHFALVQFVFHDNRIEILYLFLKFDFARWTNGQIGEYVLRDSCRGTSLTTNILSHSQSQNVGLKTERNVKKKKNSKLSTAQEKKECMCKQDICMQLLMHAAHSACIQKSLRGCMDNLSTCLPVFEDFFFLQMWIFFGSFFWYYLDLCGFYMFFPSNVTVEWFFLVVEKCLLYNNIKFVLWKAVVRFFFWMGQ